MKKIYLFLVVAFFYLALSSVVFAQKIVTTIHPYYSLVKQIAPKADVVKLLPTGVSPHLFDPSPRDVRNLADADLIILNGHVDEWALDLIDSSGTKAQVLEVFKEISFEVIEADEHGHEGEEHHDEEEHHDDDEHHDEEEHHGEEEEHHDEEEHHAEEEEHHDENMAEAHEGHGHHGHGNENPHIWLDPWLMINGVLLITEHIRAIDSDNGTSYLLNSKRLIDDIWELDRELKSLLEPVSGAAFVPFHDAWPYFARRYNLNLVVEIEPSPGQEPSAGYLAYALKEIQESSAKAVFSEVQLAPRPAEVVAENAGVNLFVLDPLGGQSGTESYQDLLRHNARTIAEALR